MRISTVGVWPDRGSSSLYRLLLDDGLLTALELERAAGAERERGVRPARALLELDLIGPRELAQALSRLTGIPVVELAGKDIPDDVIHRVPIGLASTHSVIALSHDASGLRLAMSDPTDRLALHKVRFVTGSRVTPVIAAADAIESAIRERYRLSAPDAVEGESAPTMSEVPELMVAAERGVVAKICSDVFGRLLRGDATAAEIVPRKRLLRIEWRRELEAFETRLHAIDLHQGVMAHLKILARLDVAQRWLPQRGVARFAPSEDVPLASTTLEVSTAPTRLGECATVRVVPTP